MLDAGHYADYNQSPVVINYWESRQMWKLCEYLANALEGYGFEVLKTRNDPEKDLAVTKRGQMAKDCDLFISLHSNACASPKVDRVEVYAPYDNINSSHTLARKLADAVAETMGVTAGQVKTRKSTKGEWEYYGVLRGAREAGCTLYYLIEHSFHTNKTSALWLLREPNLKALAAAEACVIANYFGVFRKGDVNTDGKIDQADLDLIKDAYFGQASLDPEQAELADVNSDGNINVFDYVKLKSEYLNK